MRQSSTPGESQSITALMDAFRLDGHSVKRVPRQIEDKPDALLEIDGVRIACECVQVPPSYIYAHQHARHSPDKWMGTDVLSLLWPNEPHQWIADALRKKSKLWSSYQASTAARYAWLLVHAPPQATQFFINGSQDWIHWALRHGSKMETHPFEQIFLWTPQSGIHTVSVARNEQGTHSELGISFRDGYPTLCVDRFSFSFITASAAYSTPHRVRHLARSRHQVVVKPRDPEYAKHPPASRPVEYICEVVTRSTEAEIQTTVRFADSGEVVQLAPQRLTNLQPNTQYWSHNLHEYKAPKSLRTLHMVQPR